MDYLNSPLNKTDQYLKIIEDTEEIINNFRDLSDLMQSRLDKKESSMFTLGKKVFNERREDIDPSVQLGSSNVSFL
ncbi:MAG: hypothetical protein WCG23_09890 [bacterium]